MKMTPWGSLLAGLLAMFILAACSGNNGATGSNGGSGLETLVSVVAVPAGATCAGGGVAVDSGVDTNGNGVLDPSEITSTQDVCNGANGAGGANGSNGYSALVAVVSEPAGTNCANGGNKVSAGLDTNANGVLDAPEITSSNYICNGANGGNGANGLNTLMAAVSEPAGSNCSNGGLKVTSGLDSNANSVLDAGEVTSTTYVCNGTNGSNGANGSNGLNSLVSIVNESAGANCTYGGQKISSGLDANNNGTLDPSEVASTKYVCNGAGINWVDVTGTSVSAASNTGYLADNALQVRVTLPAAPALGDIVQVTGAGTGGWVVAQNAGQSVITKHLVDPSIGAVWTAHGPGTVWWSLASSSDGTKLVATTLGDYIYTSDDSGVTWNARESPRYWWGVASSADGTKLVASDPGDGVLFTSTDSGLNWTAHLPPAPVANWTGVASSSDGTKLVAVANGGQIYTSTDSGANWTARDTARNWLSVASSSDGTKLVAVENGGQIYTSTDSGATWTPRGPVAYWRAIASSSDGSKLVAVAADLAGNNPDQIYTSTDSGVSWTARDSARFWLNVASSSDGSKLVATENQGYIYTSIDSGVTWMPHWVAGGASWWAVASSADGSRLVTADESGSGIFTSAPTALQSTTVGTAGLINGGQYDAIELQYVGNGIFTILSSEGNLAAQ